MNLVYGAVFLVLAGGGIYILARPQPADEYAISVPDAYKKLSTVRLTPGEHGVFGGLATHVDGNGRSQVEWTAHGSFAAFDCKIGLAALSETRTKVAVSCDGAGGEAAQGLLMTMERDAVIEMVDATLKGRAYDPELAKGATAYRWPEDVVHHADIHEAVHDAVKMGADIADESAKHIDNGPPPPPDQGPVMDTRPEDNTQPTNP